jgi:hypothetical protein
MRPNEFIEPASQHDNQVPAASSCYAPPSQNTDCFDETFKKFVVTGMSQPREELLLFFRV